MQTKVESRGEPQTSAVDLKCSPYILDTPYSLTTSGFSKNYNNKGLQCTIRDLGDKKLKKKKT
jgi:hypothetical protein